MIADIALALSILNTIFWVLLIIVIKKVFRTMYPIIKSLTGMPSYDTMVLPSIPGESNSEV